MRQATTLAACFLCSWTHAQAPCGTPCNSAAAERGVMATQAGDAPATKPSHAEAIWGAHTKLGARHRACAPNSARKGENTNKPLRLEVDVRAALRRLSTASVPSRDMVMHATPLRPGCSDCEIHPSDANGRARLHPWSLENATYPAHTWFASGMFFVADGLQVGSGRRTAGSTIPGQSEDWGSTSTEIGWHNSLGMTTLGTSRSRQKNTNMSWWPNCGQRRRQRRVCTCV